MAQLPKCGRKGCQNRVTKARNTFCTHECAQAASRSSKPAKPTDSMVVNGDRCELTKTTKETVRTLADLIRVCKIDTSEWEVERWVANKWDVGMKPPATTVWVDGKRGTYPAFTREGGDPIVTELYQVKAWLKRRVGLIAARNEISDLIADAKARIPKRPALAHLHAPTGHMLELSIPDLHVGKLAWADETGHGHYDSKIAEQRFVDALETLIQRTSGYRFDQIIFTVGNDLLHSDNVENTTTSGTQVGSDSRFYKMFGIVRRMITRAVDRLRIIAPVKVIVVPGNHDTLTAWHLGDSLECFFHDCPDVEIDNAPTMRKYHQFGKCMLMLTHGDEVKREKLPLLMATEQPAMFGATKYREAHTGHTHEHRVIEINGVRVRTTSALCEVDAWHAKKGYVGNIKAAEAFVWDSEEGIVSMSFATAKKDS